MAVGTYQGVAGLAPRPFTLEEETGSHHGRTFAKTARRPRSSAGRIHAEACVCVATAMAAPLPQAAFELRYYFRGVW